MGQRWRVLLVGLGETALTALDSLAENLQVVGIFRPASTDGLSHDPVLQRAEQLGIPIFSDLSQAAIRNIALEVRPDCVVVSSYNRIISPDLLRTLPFVNVHYSPLPEYRGRANVNWAIINNEPDTAITIHVMAPELDAGNILFQRRVPILPRDTAGTLYARLNALQREHLASSVQHFLDGDPGKPQPEDGASYGCTRLPSDGYIDWSAPTDAIDRLIRALDRPFPGAYTFLEARKLVIWSAEPVGNPRNYAGRIPGRVVSRSNSGGYVDVLTGDGVLRLTTVQFEGEGLSSASNAVRSVRLSLGLSLESLLARVQQLEAMLQSEGSNRHQVDEGSGS